MSVKRLFIFYCIVLTIVLDVMWHYSYTKELIFWIGLTCFISGIIMCFLAKILLFMREGGNPERARIIWRTIGFVGIALIIGILTGIYIVRGKKMLTTIFEPKEKEIPKEVTIEQINQRVSRLTLEPSLLIFRQPVHSGAYRPYEPLQSNLVPPEPSQQPKSQYVVSIKDNSSMPFYLFDVTQYTMRRGEGWPVTPTLQICKFIDEMYDEKDPILEAIRKLPIEISVKSCLNLPVPELTVELLYIIRKVSKLPHSRIEILVKGYADGQMSEWEKPLRSGRYAYREIPLYPKVKHSSANSYDYIHSALRTPVPYFYTNNTLPNLRAMFIKEELIEPILSQCAMPRSVEAYVLEGDEFSEIDRLKRKVQIYILLF